MSVTYTISQNSPLSFLVKFTSDQTPPVTFSIYLSGNLVSTITSSTGSGSASFTVGSNESPFLEVLDYSGLPHPAFPGKFSLHWREWAGASEYLVQQYIGSTWTTVATVPDSPNSESYTYTTGWLSDETTYQFQVIAVDAAGNQGTPLGFTFTEIRNPNPPSVSYAYASNVLTISAS